MDCLDYILEAINEIEELACYCTWYKYWHLGRTGFGRCAPIPGGY